MASAIACFLGAGDTLLSQLSVRGRSSASHSTRRPKLGQGAGPVGSANVRLDIGPGPRLNQVTLTVNDYAKSVHFYSLLGLKQIVDSPETIRPLRDGGRRDFVDPGGSGRESGRHDRCLSRMR